MASRRGAKPAPSSEWVVMCDFDGTITMQDTAEYILRRHANGDWLSLDAKLDRGEISIDECMNEQFAMVDLTEAEIIEELDGVVQIRPGFPELVRSCHRRGIEFYVVSAGLSFAIRHFIGEMGLGQDVRLHMPVARHEGKRTTFTFPPLMMPGSKSFKDDLVMRHQSGGRKVAYIGDGPPDLEAAMKADLRFAVKGTQLESMLRERGMECQVFDRFDEVRASLERSI